MSKRKILVQPDKDGQLRKRAYCGKCNKRIGLYSKECHHCGEAVQR